MTCITGIKTKDNVFIAGDRMGSNGLTHLQTKEPKIFKNGDFLFGVCGSYRVMQLLKYKFKPPRIGREQTISEYLYIDFVDSVIKLLSENNATHKKDAMHKFDGSFLFAFDNELYQMESNFQILCDVRDYNSSGSGCYHAMASLYSTDGLKLDPKERLKKAIICASDFVISVDDKIDILSLNEVKKGKKVSK